MVTNVFALLWSVVTLPVRLVLLPFKIVSFVISLLFYALVLLVLGGLVFLFLL